MNCLGLLLLLLVAPYKYFCQCFIWVKTDSLCSVNIHPSRVEACLSVGWFKYLPGLWIPNGVQDRRGGLRCLAQTNGDVSVYVRQQSFKFCGSLYQLLGTTQEKRMEWRITWPKGAGAAAKAAAWICLWWSLKRNKIKKCCLFLTAFCNLCICNMRWVLWRTAPQCGLCKQVREWPQHWHSLCLPLQVTRAASWRVFADAKPIFSGVSHHL